MISDLDVCMACWFKVKLESRDHSSFRNELKYRNADRLVNSNDDSAASCKNFVNVGRVTPEFTMLICIHPSSISSGVSIAPFA